MVESGEFVVPGTELGFSEFIPRRAFEENVEGLCGYHRRPGGRPKGEEDSRDPATSVPSAQGRGYCRGVVDVKQQVAIVNIFKDGSVDLTGT